MRIVVLPGDGIGPEVTLAAIEVLTAAKRNFALDVTVDASLLWVGAGVAMIAAARQFEHQMKLLQTVERQEQAAAKLLSANGM